MKAVHLLPLYPTSRLTGCFHSSPLHSLSLQHSFACSFLAWVHQVLLSSFAPCSEVETVSWRP